MIWRARSTRAWLLLVVLAAVLGAPAGAGAQDDGRVSVVRFPFPQEDGTLTPYTFELGYPLVSLVYDTLMWRDVDGKPQPWLARSVTTSGTQVTIQLRQGVRWHDGAPLTAADVAFTFDYVADHPHPRFTPEVSAIESVTAPSASTVVITLKHPSPGFEDQPLSDVPIIPRHLWQSLPSGQLAPAGLPVGTGPYRLVGHQTGSIYRFEANEDYFRGRPEVNRIEVPIITDYRATLRALDGRRVDMVPVSLPSEDADDIDSFDVDVARGPFYLGTVLMLNVRQPPFDDPVVRSALSNALDLDRVAEQIGDATPADRGYIHPASAWSPGVPVHNFDPESARTAVAGVSLPTIPVLAPDNDPVKLEAGHQVVLALQKVGIDAQLQSMPRDQLASAVGENGAPPAFSAAIYSAPPLASYDPDFLQRVFGSDPGTSPLNYTGYQSEGFDRAARRVATATNVAARRRAIAAELRLLAEDNAIVPLFFAQGAFAFRPSAYNGWVFVKGTGILDKRSFLESPGQGPLSTPAPPRQGLPVGAPATEESLFESLGIFGIVSAGLFGLALLTLAVWLVRRH